MNIERLLNMAVAKPVVADPPADPARDNPAESEEERLVRLARRHGLPKPALKISDLPEHPDVLDAPEARRLTEFFDHRLALLSDGTLLMADSLLDEPGLTQSCRAVLNSMPDVPRIRMLPARVSVIRMVLDLLDSGGASVVAVDNGNRVVTNQQQTLQDIVESALVQDASDIHIFVRRHQTRISFRVFGSLVDYDVWTRSAGEEITNLIFNDASDTITGNLNKNIPMDASMNVLVRYQEQYTQVRCRIALMPELNGYNVTIRLLSSTEQVALIESLGFSEAHLKLLTRAAQLSHGTIIIAGPTGSGKTTTLATLLALVPQTLKIITVEDPPEKLVPGASQTPVNDNNENLSFAHLSRATLRHDPDVIMIGEVRDDATADVVVQAATTGHLVLSTLHTNSAISIVTRLIDLRVMSQRLADPGLLKLLVFQRLIPVACPGCRMNLGAPEAADVHGADVVDRLREYFGDDPGVRLRNPAGCRSCRGGVVGRTVAAELIWVDNADRAYIQKADILHWQQHLQKGGWQSIEHHAENKVRTGQVCPLDVEYVLNLLFSEEP